MKMRKKDNQALTPELGNRSVLPPAWKPFFRAARRLKGMIISKLKKGPLMVDASKLMMEFHNDGRSSYDGNQSYDGHPSYEQKFTTHTYDDCSS